ncbi:MAG: 5'/3'-nucleotidase SurE [Litorivicinus sp.]
MRILISNDDGVHSPGLATLAQTLATEHEVLVVAPDRDHSGASNSLTLTRPLTLDRLENGYYRCDGTPTDCVHLGLRMFRDHAPDLVVSGINLGPNLGDDTLYSGTVAAAMEGRYLDLPALAVSLERSDQWYFDTAADLALGLLRCWDQLPAGRVMNLNVPGMPRDQIQGILPTRLGHRTMGADPIAAPDPRGKERLWLNLAGQAQDRAQGTDFWAIEHGFASLTPVQPDMTDHRLMEQLTQWCP